MVTYYALEPGKVFSYIPIDRGRCYFVALAYKQGIKLCNCTIPAHTEFYETVRALMLAGY